MATKMLNSLLQTQLEQDLFDKYGPMMTGDNLRIALGYPSKDAFRQALVRKTLPIPVFSIEKRRGKFALTKDVAIWIAEQRLQGNLTGKE